MIIDSTTDSINVLLSGNVITSQLDIISSYNTITTTSLTPGKFQGTTNNLTPVTIVPSPGVNQQNQLRFCSIYNNDSTNATVTIQYSGNAGQSIIFISSIDAGDSIQFTHDKGWGTYGAEGEQRVLGMNDAPGELRFPINLKPINLTDILTLASGTDYGFHLGEADRAYSKVSIRYNVVSNINTTGNKTTTINVTGITENDDLFVVFGTVHTGTFTLRAGLVDSLESGGAGSVAGSLRPSTNSSLTLNTSGVLNIPWIAYQPSQW